MATDKEGIYISKNYFIAIGVIVLALIIALAFLWGKASVPQGREKGGIGEIKQETVEQLRLVEIPDLTEKTSAEAESKLKSIGLKFRIKGQIVKKDIPPDRVVWQEPSPGVKVKRGTIIKIWLSMEPL